MHAGSTEVFHDRGYTIAPRGSVLTQLLLWAYSESTLYKHRCHTKSESQSSDINFSNFDGIKAGSDFISRCRVCACLSWSPHFPCLRPLQCTARECLCDWLIKWLDANHCEPKSIPSRRTPTGRQGSGLDSLELPCVYEEVLSICRFCSCHCMSKVLGRSKTKPQRMADLGSFLSPRGGRPWIPRD